MPFINGPCGRHRVALSTRIATYWGTGSKYYKICDNICLHFLWRYIDIGDSLWFFLQVEPPPFQIRHIDQITLAKKENDKCTLINTDLPKIRFVGGGTFTYGALEDSQVMVIPAQETIGSIKILFLFSKTRKFSNRPGSTVKR